MLTLGGSNTPDCSISQCLQLSREGISAFSRGLSSQSSQSFCFTHRGHSLIAFPLLNGAQENIRLALALALFSWLSATVSCPRVFKACEQLSALIYDYPGGNNINCSQFSFAKICPSKVSSKDTVPEHAAFHLHRHFHWSDFQRVGPGDQYVVLSRSAKEAVILSSFMPGSYLSAEAAKP